MKRKIIEVVDGYASVGETGHINRAGKFGMEVWTFPIIYIDCPNPDTFRKVRITYEEKR